MSPLTIPPQAFNWSMGGFDTELSIEGLKSGPCRVGPILNRVGPCFTEWFTAMCSDQSSEGESTRSAFEARGLSEGEKHEVIQPGREGGDKGGLPDEVDPKALLPSREGYEAVVACPRVKVLQKVVSGRSPPFDPADKGMVDLRYASEEVTDTEADKGTHPGHAF
ncbi:hypothetical protein LWI29_013147 [Acer saccharum]|uniref:Uncharacterized protein n=1 Tax=Acer saccharum TaxID=4024 RepID=A0AA39RUM4_ACESA|nr:hypothetical protein LWI29_013147 [Acer saccharum]